jgi:hypothetical protein
VPFTLSLRRYTAGAAGADDDLNSDDDYESDSDDGLPPLEVNRNWRPLEVDLSSEEDSSSEDED